MVNLPGHCDRHTASYGHGKDSHVKEKGRIFREKTALSPDMENHKAHSSNLGRCVCSFQAGREREIVEVQFFILVLPVFKKDRK